ncbi:MAG: BPSS1780 family membrane protein [Burkholderiales bacterium]
MNIRRCNPLYGYGWLRTGVALFLAQPWPWLALVGMSFLGTLLLGTLPILGLLAVFLLTPGLAAGFMAAGRAAAAGEPLGFSHLTAGLRTAARPLIAVGGVNLLAVLVAMLIFSLGWREEMTRLLELMGSPQPDEAVLKEALTRLTLPSLLMLALLLPLAMANWFAPALVLFQGLSAGAALRLSLAASLRNVWPFLVYGVLLFLLDAIASLMLQGVVGLTLRIAGPAVAQIFGLFLAFPLFCAFAAVVLASMYASYVDIFETAPQNAGH